MAAVQIHEDLEFALRRMGLHILQSSWSLQGIEDKWILKLEWTRSVPINIINLPNQPTKRTIRRRERDRRRLESFISKKKAKRKVSDSEIPQSLQNQTVCNESESEHHNNGQRQESPSETTLLTEKTENELEPEEGTNANEKIYYVHDKVDVDILAISNTTRTKQQTSFSMDKTATVDDCLWEYVRSHMKRNSKSVVDSFTVSLIVPPDEFSPRRRFEITDHNIELGTIPTLMLMPQRLQLEFRTDRSDLINN